MKRLLFMLFSVAAAAAAAISQTAHCLIEPPHGEPPVSVTGSAPCSLTGDKNGLPLSTAAAYAIPDVSGNYAGGSVGASIHVHGYYEFGETGAPVNVQTSYAYANASVSYLFGTSGPARQGTIIYEYGMRADGTEGGRGSVYAEVGPIQIEGHSQSYHTPYYETREDPDPVPFALGTNFEFRVEAVATGAPFLLFEDTMWPDAYGNASTGLRFWVYEADGLTPVPLIPGGVTQPAPVPEPASIVLTAFSILVFALHRRSTGKRERSVVYLHRIRVPGLW